MNLPDETVIAIRERYLPRWRWGERPNHARDIAGVAREFQVSKGVVWGIITGKTYKHLPLGIQPIHGKGVDIFLKPYRDERMYRLACEAWPTDPSPNKYENIDRARRTLAQMKAGVA